MCHPSAAVATANPEVCMSDEAISTFLQRIGDGVLTLTGNGTSSLPVSFGYDVETGNVVLQLFTDPESPRGDQLARDSTPATLVAYDCEGPDDWTSVVVDGVLTQQTADAIDQQQFVEQATPVGMSVFDTDPETLRMEWYELQPTTVSGRRSPE